MNRPAALNPVLLRFAADALGAVRRFTEPADATLRAFFREHPRLGARDRAWISDQVFEALRHGLALEHLTGGTAPRDHLLVSMLKWGGLSIRDLEPLLDPGESGRLADLRARRLDEAPLAARAELPQWVIDRLGLPEGEALALGRTLSTPAPFDLRVNVQKGTRVDVLERLRADGIQAEPTPWSPWGIRINARFALQRHPLLEQGLLEVQDEGSQLLALLVAPRRQDMVADFCAGAGGKTLALGALMRSQGRLYAFDVSEKRLQRLTPRLRRSGLSNVQPVRIAHEGDPRLKRLAGKMDRVLVDAPCSGFGTLRRNPDLKWRQTEADLAELTSVQGRILSAAARLVRPGGRLVYATCSLLRQENHDIVHSFLREVTGFQVVSAGNALAAQQIGIEAGEFLELRPDRHGTDGFFGAVLERAR